MAEMTKRVETWRPNVPLGEKPAAARYGGHDAPAGPGAEAPEQPNPSDPANTGTTPRTVAEVG